MQIADAEIIRALAYSHTLSHDIGRSERIRWPCGRIAGLDYLSYPTGVIQEAQDLAAEAFGAEQTWFLVNGTTAGMAHHTPVHIQACQQGGLKDVTTHAYPFEDFSCLNTMICPPPVQGYMLQ